MFLGRSVYFSVLVFNCFVVAFLLSIRWLESWFSHWCCGVLIEVLLACVACWWTAACHVLCRDVQEVVQVCRPPLLTSSHLEDWEKCVGNYRSLKAEERMH